MKNKIINFLKNESLSHITNYCDFHEQVVLIHNILGGYIVAVFLNGKVEYTNKIDEPSFSFVLKDDFIRRRIFSLYYTNRSINETYKKEWNLFLREQKIKKILNE